MPDDTEWFANERFWEWSFPMMFPQSRFVQAEEEVAQLRALSGVEDGALLDLACGPGRHSVIFAKQGFAVTGVDRSAFLLELARRSSAGEGVQVDWVQQDMRDFRRPDGYDLALSVFTSFGYFELAEDNQKVLDNVHASLRTGGRLVLHVLGKEALARNFVATESKEIEGRGTLFQRRMVKDDWTRLEAEWTLVAGTTAQRYGFRVWIYSGSELKRMLEAAGFSSVELYGDLGGSPYDMDARRLVALATK